MAEREQKRRQAPSRETEEVEPVAPATERGDKLKAEIIASARGDFLNPPTDTVMKNYQASQHKSSFQKLLKP